MSWGEKARDNRQFINAVLWILRTDSPWRDLPPDYGDWKNTHRRFCRWRDKGIWEDLLGKLIVDPDYEWLMTDASHVKSILMQQKQGAVTQDMSRTQGSSIRSYILPWMRMVCRSEPLLFQVPSLIASKLSILLKE